MLCRIRTHNHISCPNFESLAENAFFSVRAAAGNSNHKSGVNTQFCVVLLFGAREFQILPDIPSYQTLSDTEGVRIGKSQHVSGR